MDITGMLAVTFIFGGGATVLLAMSPIGRAIGDRIRGTARGGEDRLRAIEDNYEALLDEVESMRLEFTDLQERLDFTERLLARDEPKKLEARDDVQS